MDSRYFLLYYETSNVSFNDRKILFRQRSNPKNDFIKFRAFKINITHVLTVTKMEEIWLLDTIKYLPENT